MKNKISVLALSLLTLFSCKKDTPSDTTIAGFVANASNGVYIVNEGQFQSGNSSISYYSGSGSTSVKDAYYQANTLALGDVAQSISKVNGNLFIVVNNSAKIEVTNVTTMKKEGTITGLTSPRYFLPVSASKAYVTDLYSGSISVLNLANNNSISHIPLSGSTEQLIVLNNNVYVTNMSTSYLYKINPTTDTVIDSLQIGFGGNSIFSDKNNKIWVLCGGDYSTNTPSSLYRIDPATFTTEIALNFPAQTYLNKITINDSKDEMYFLNTDIYKMNITDSALPTTSFVAANGKNYYAIGFNNITQRIYAGDAIDFQSAGRVYVYDLSGAEVANFAAGINPSSFLFLGN